MMMWKSVVLVLLVMVFGGSSGASAVPITNGLVAGYEFNGNANDVSGNGNNGVVNGATLTTDRFGNVGAAYSFDGVNDSIVLPPAPHLAFYTSDFSIVTWIKTSSERFYIDERVGTEYGWSLHASVDSSGVWVSRFHVQDAGTGGVTANANDQLVADQWHHIAAVRNGGTNLLYIDGALSGQGTGALINIGGSDPINIGRRFVGEYSEGSVDDFFVFDRALSPSEVQTLFSVVPEPNTAIFLGIGLAGLGMRRTRRGC